MSVVGDVRGQPQGEQLIQGNQETRVLRERSLPQWPLVFRFWTLSLYSTATQNYWPRGLALGNAKINQHVGIFWCYLTLKFALPLTPNLKFALPPTRTPDASQWNIGGVRSSGVGHVYFIYISCIFHVVCTSFSALATRELANAKADSSGIWALDIRNIHHIVWCHIFIGFRPPIKVMWMPHTCRWGLNHTFIQHHYDVL